jgi:hypothetical protein
MTVKLHTTIFRITASACICHGGFFIHRKIFCTTWITVPESQIGNGIICFGTFKTANCVLKAILLDTLVKTIVIEESAKAWVGKQMSREP